MDQIKSNTTGIQNSYAHLKWVEKFIAVLQANKKEKISFVSCIGSVQNFSNNFLFNLTQKSFWVNSNELDVYYEKSNFQCALLYFCHRCSSLELIRVTKFMFLTSSHFFICLNSKHTLYDEISLAAVQSLFFHSIYEIKKDRIKKSSIFFIVNNFQVPLLGGDKMIKIEKLWEKCLVKSDFKKFIKLENYFDFEFLNDLQFSKIKEILAVKSQLTYDVLCLKTTLHKKWDISAELSNALLTSIEASEIKKSIVSYFTDLSYDESLELFYQIFKKWNKIVYKGELIDNYGKVTLHFWDTVNQKFNQLVPVELHNSSIFTKKKKELYDFFQEKITDLFTKQLLSLQSQALDKFKDLFSENLSFSKKDFESEKKLMIESMDQWFLFHAKPLVAGCSKLSYFAAQKELNDVLEEFSEKLKESSSVKIRVLQNLEKQVSTSNLKQTGVMIGFGLTAAYRPNGFGNFQFVSSYTQGPHVFNFSIVNDKDIAEQEGQGKIRNFRIQPSLNFDIEL